MKKVVLSLAAMLAFGLANAQETTTDNGGFSQGDVFISGSVGYGSDEDFNGDKVNEFNISPKAGYFVTNNIAVGLSLGYTNSKTEESGEADTKFNTFEVGAFGRYYFTPASQFSIFGQLGLGYSTSKAEQGDAETKFNGFNVGLAPGISYFVSKNIALEATFGLLGYQSVKNDDTDAKADSFDLGLDLGDINFGIVYKF